MLALINYRLFRLRRLIVLALLPTVAATLWIAGDLDGSVLIVSAIVASLPLLHALRYPGMWYETLSVSVGCVAIIFMLPYVEDAVGPTTWWLYLALFLCLGMLVFCAVLFVACKGLMKGPTRRMTLESSAMSQLDPAKLKSGITLYPGRDDERAKCGEPDELGIFKTTILTQTLAPTPDPVEFEESSHVSWVETENGEFQSEMMLKCRIEKSTDTEHHVIFQFGDDPDPGVTIHRFEPMEGGTRVTAIERTQNAPVLCTVGMWLEDFFADYLVSEIERVEGTPPLANRNRTMRQFVVDLAWLLKPFTWSDPNQP